MKIVRTADGKIRIEETEADRIEAASRRQQDRAAVNARHQGYRSLLNSRPTNRNSSLLRAIAAGLRSHGKSVESKAVSPYHGLNTAMQYVCEAIAAGAFSSPEYIPFRVHVATYPNFEDAAVSLLKWDYRQGDTLTRCMTEGCALVADMIDAEAGSLASDLVGEHKQIQVPSAKKDANKPKLFHSGNETEGRWLQYPIPLSVIAKTIGMKVRTAKKYLAVTGLIQKTPEGWTVRLDNINPTLALNLQKVSSEARLAGK